MREIKFRGLRADNKEWIYGNIHIPNKLFSNTFICPDTTYGDVAPGLEDGDDFNEIKKHGAAIGHYHRIIDGTEGQFTGLKDKNGKDIYEGDIVKLEYPLNLGIWGYSKREIVTTIVFESGCFWFTGEGFTDCSWHFYNEYEVIGNIYESPELLNQ